MGNGSDVQLKSISVPKSKFHIIEPDVFTNYEKVKNPKVSITVSSSVDADCGGVGGGDCLALALNPSVVSRPPDVKLHYITIKVLD